jgi:hypothetical protein
MMTPLGMPEGSVRAMLAVGAFASAAFLWVTGESVTDEHLTIVTVAVTYYFAARQGEQRQAPPVEKHRDLLEEARAEARVIRDGDSL